MQNIIITIPLDELKSLIVETIRNEFKKMETFKIKPEEHLLTRKETAKILGISLVTLNEWTKKGLIPAYRISSRVRYKKAEIIDSITMIKTLKYKKGI